MNSDYHQLATASAVASRNASVAQAELLVTKRIESYLRRAIVVQPNSHVLHHLLGASLHLQGRASEALPMYLRAETLEPGYLPAMSNIGAAYQSLGDVNKAEAIYAHLLPLLPNDAGLRNNYGSLLGIMGRKDEEVHWLLHSVAMNPALENVHINLAGHYQDDGDLLKARHHLQQALPLGNKNDVLQLRIALLLSPVPRSWFHLAQERLRLERDVQNLLQTPDAEAPDARGSEGDRDDEQVQGACATGSTRRAVTLTAMDSHMDRIHFYMAYHGLNDRHMQVRMSHIFPRPWSVDTSSHASSDLITLLYTFSTLLFLTGAHCQCISTLLCAVPRERTLGRPFCAREAARS